MCRRFDQYGNIVTGFSGSVSISSSDHQAVAIVGGNTSLTAGSGIFQVALDAVDNVTLTAGVGEIEGSTGVIQVEPAAANSFAISAPTTAAVGTAFTVTLTAKDPFGNIATAYNGTVTFASSDHQAVTATSMSWGNGVGTAQLTLSTPNTVTLTATAGGVQGATADVIVESSPSQAISSGLASLATWGGTLSFPLVGTVTSVQQALQSGLVDPITNYLATGSPSDAAFLALLQSLSPAGVTKSTSGNVVKFTLNFQASAMAATSLGSLGSQADGLGIKLDPGTKVDVTTTLNFSFTFGVDTSGQAPTFILAAPANGLNVGVSISANNINSAIDIGFLARASTMERSSAVLRPQMPRLSRALATSNPTRPSSAPRAR